MNAMAGEGTRDATRVLVVDDNAILRMGLTSLLRSNPLMSVVGEAVDGQDAVEAATRLRPDVVLLDVRMPRRDGLSALPEVLATGAKVIMLTFSDEPEVIGEALRAGAAGYLIHGTFDANALADNITAVVSGCRLLSAGVVSELLAPRSHVAPDRSAYGLSGRQTEVMDAIARGLSNGAIAQQLFLSEKTVKNHINQIFAKLGASSRGEAIATWMGHAPPGSG